MSNSPSDPFHWQEFGTASQKGKLPDTDGNIRVQSGIELVPGRENNAVDSWRAQERLATGAPSLDNHQMQLELEAEIDSEKAAEDALLMRYGLDVLHLSPLLDSTGQPGTSTVNGSKVWVRRAAKAEFRKSESLRREIAALSVISDNWAPHLVESAEFLSSIWVVTEKRPGIPLSQYIQSHKSPPVDQVKSLITQLFSGVAVIFYSGFAHLRLCAETILVDDVGQLSIGEFEHAYEYTTEAIDGIHASVDAKIGEDIYTAPEVFASIRYNARKAVMWSCGVVVYFICTGQTDMLSTLAHPAFENEDSAKPKRKISTASQQALKVPVVNYPDRFAVPNYARDIISKMLQVEPSKRAELIEVAAKVPKEFLGEEMRPLMELAWLDYKSHVGPLAGLSQGTSDNSSLFSFGGTSVFSKQSFSQLLPGRRKSSVTRDWTAAASPSGNSRRRSFFGYHHAHHPAQPPIVDAESTSCPPTPYSVSKSYPTQEKSVVQ